MDRSYERLQEPITSTTNTNKNAKPNPWDYATGYTHNFLFIIKKNTVGTLYGNPCFQQATQEMGFEYVVMPKGMAGYRNEASRFFQNLPVWSKLVLSKGPFWKLRIKKRFNECKYGTGDYVG